MSDLGSLLRQVAALGYDGMVLQQDHTGLWWFAAERHQPHHTIASCELPTPEEAVKAALEEVAGI